MTWKDFMDAQLKYWQTSAAEGSAQAHRLSMQINQVGATQDAIKFVADYNHTVALTKEALANLNQKQVEYYYKAKDEGDKIMSNIINIEDEASKLIQKTKSGLIDPAAAVSAWLKSPQNKTILKLQSDMGRVDPEVISALVQRYISNQDMTLDDAKQLFPGLKGNWNSIRNNLKLAAQEVATQTTVPERERKAAEERLEWLKNTREQQINALIAWSASSGLSLGTWGTSKDILAKGMPAFEQGGAGDRVKEFLKKHRTEE